jgi:hypothetical protein
MRSFARQNVAVESDFVAKQTRLEARETKGALVNSLWLEQIKNGSIYKCATPVEYYRCQ